MASEHPRAGSRVSVRTQSPGLSATTSRCQLWSAHPRATPWHGSELPFFLINRSSKPLPSSPASPYSPPELGSGRLEAGGVSQRPNDPSRALVPFCSDPGRRPRHPQLKRSQPPLCPDGSLNVSARRLSLRFGYTLSRVENTAVTAAVGHVENSGFCIARWGCGRAPKIESI